MITAIPTSPISWSAKNIDKAESVGIEFALSLFKTNDIGNKRDCHASLQDARNDEKEQYQKGRSVLRSYNIKVLTLSYTLQQIKDKSGFYPSHNKQLPYTPNELLSFLFCCGIYDFDLGAKCEYSSHRYIQADNSNNAVIPSYFIVDLFISKQIEINKLNLILRLDIKNIFNTQYEIINNYIMPRRQIKGGVSVMLN
jgi:outer membrane cobalamin receptor